MVESPSRVGEPGGASGSPEGWCNECDLQPQAADEEALGGACALPRDHRRGARRGRLLPALQAPLSRPRGGDGLPGAPYPDSPYTSTAMTARIVISEFMDAPGGGAARGALRRGLPAEARGRCRLRWARRCPSAAAWIVRNRTQVRGALLAAAARLSVVGRLGVGLDNIDVVACECARHRGDPRQRGQRGIGRRVRRRDRADPAARRLSSRLRAVEAGTWPRHMLSQGREAAGKMIGVIGLRQHRAAHRAQGCGAGHARGGATTRW